MSSIILLYSGPLGLVINPPASTEILECNLWMQAQLTIGVWVLVPTISDYGVRRKLLHADKRKGVARLDQLIGAVGYAEISTEVMRQAASFWAQARKMGKPTAPEAALDGDMIIAAHSEVLSDAGHQVIVATTNVKHLQLFVDARLWRDIT